MTQWLRVLATLPEDPGSISSTPTVCTLVPVDPTL